MKKVEVSILVKDDDSNSWREVLTIISLGGDSDSLLSNVFNTYIGTDLSLKKSLDNWVS